MQNDGYNTDDDIENQHFIKSHEADSERDEAKFSAEAIRETKQTNIKTLRLVNLITIAVLVSNYFCTSFLKVNSDNYLLIKEYLLHENLIKSEINLVILYIAFVFVLSNFYFKNRQSVC